MTSIVIIEDDVNINNLVRDSLQNEGYQVIQGFEGTGAAALVEAHRPDLVILDWMLPGMDGLTVCRQIRQNSLVPIIMLTARGEEIDRVVGLEIGADDYVVKPFGMRELLARVRANLRRVGFDSAASSASDSASSAQSGAVTSPQSDEFVTHGKLVIDLAGRSVTVEGQPVDLTRREFDLLTLMATNPGRAFSRAYLLERVWGDEVAVFDRTVDSHVVRLRRKLGDEGERIATIWGVGYRFSA